MGVEGQGEKPGRRQARQPWRWRPRRAGDAASRGIGFRGGDSRLGVRQTSGRKARAGRKASGEKEGRLGDHPVLGDGSQIAALHDMIHRTALYWLVRRVRHAPGGGGRCLDAPLAQCPYRAA